MQNIQEFDKEFPARLEFFKKGKSFYLKIMGKACIVNDPEEVNGLVHVSDEVKSKAMCQLVFVKVKMQSAEYMENTPPETNGWLHAVRVHNSTSGLDTRQATDHILYNPHTNNKNFIIEKIY